MIKTHDFTVDWFDGVQPYFEAILKPLAHTKDYKKVLEIGSYEGASTVWLLENFLVEDNDSITCIDTWKGGVEHQGQDFEAIFERFQNNISPFKEKVKLHRYDSSDALIDLNYSLQKEDHYDFIYIDGSHNAWDTLSDAVLAFKLLKPNGIMAFDDYIWGGPKDSWRTNTEQERPGPAIDSFLYCYKDFFNIITNRGQQVWLQKNS